MNVKNIIKIACDFVEMNDLKNSLDSTLTTAQQENLDELLQCFNWVNEEITTEYFPLYTKQIVEKENSLNFSDLEKNIISVLNIKLSKVKKDFFTYPDKIEFDGKIDEITYSYLPEVLEINDEAYSFVPERVYAYGVAREFYLQKGITDKAISFNSRFQDSIQNFLKSNANFNKNMPARKWF